MTITINAQLSHATYNHAADQNTHLVLTLTAPAKEGEAARPTLCVVPVIDTSGSMSGAPLEGAKRSVEQLLTHLKDGDYCGLVAFATGVEVIFEPQKITPESRARLLAAVGKLRASGSTNFAGGMLKAFELVDNLDLPTAVMKRVIMLTDGEANVGPAQRPEAILKLLVNAGATTVSAFGYGEHVKQDFLTDLARDGAGSYATIDHPDAALTAFGRELGGLISTYATDLVIEVERQAGHFVRAVVSDVEHEIETIGNEVTIKLPALLAEETRHLVLDVRLAEQKQAFPRPVNAFEVKVRYQTITAEGRVVAETAEAKSRAQFVKAGEEAKQPRAELGPVVAMAQLARAQKEAEAQAKRGDFAGAAQTFHAVANEVKTSGNIQVAHTAMRLGDNYGDERRYAASARYRASMGTGLTRGMGAANYDAGAADDLSSLGVVLSNSAMSHTGQLFAARPGTDATPQPVTNLGDITGSVQPAPLTLAEAIAAAPEPAEGTSLADYLAQNPSE